MPTPRRRGRCRVLYCFDVARAIDLAQASTKLQAARRTEFHHKGVFPAGGVLAAPLRLSWGAAVLGEEALGRWSPHAGSLGTERMEAAERAAWPPADGPALGPDVEVAIYDFGAIAVTWTIAFETPLEDLVELAGVLYENTHLTTASRAAVVELLAALGAAAERPRLLDLVEDYFVLELEPVSEGIEAFVRDQREVLARVLRAEAAPLSEQEVESAIGNAASYGREDVALVDWLGAILVGEDTQDERLLLELATVELLELRVLDNQLDPEVEAAYALFAQRRTFWSRWGTRPSELERLARAQADDALLHEGIDNALKLFGDSYLARVYGIAAARFHFDDYDLTIQRKLTVLERIYQRLFDQATTRRAEILEWIIILLIAGEIVMALA
jgi:hypothetical protein